MEFAHFKTAMQFQRWQKAHLQGRLFLYRRLTKISDGQLARLVTRR